MEPYIVAEFTFITLMVVLTRVAGHGNITEVLVVSEANTNTTVVGESGNDTAAINAQNGDLRFDKATDDGYRSGSNIDAVAVYQNGTWKSVCYDVTNNSSLDFRSICFEQFHTYP